MSRSGSLGEIARDGHVYSYKVSIQSLTALGGALEPTLTGWKEASTFPGFCGAHDKSIFAPLEDKPFTGSEEQCYLLGYRALAWEYYAKLRATKSNGFRLAYADGLSQFVQEAVTQFNSGGDLGLMDLTARKSAMDADLETENWSSLNGLLVEFDRTFPIQCAAAWSPTEDLQGKYLQSLNNKNKVPEGATISSFAANGKSYLLLSWLDDSNNVGTKLAVSIETIPNEEKAGALAAWLLLTSENCHLSPDWFESLDEKEKNTVNMLMHPTGTADCAMSFSKRVGIDEIGIVSCRRIGVT